MIRASQELASKVPTQKPPPETGRWLSERLVQNVLTLEESLQRFYTGCKNFDIAVIYRRDKRDIPGLFVLHVPVSNGESTGKIQSFREYGFVIIERESRYQNGVVIQLQLQIAIVLVPDRISLSSFWKVTTESSVFPSTNAIL